MMCLSAAGVPLVGWVVSILVFFFTIIVIMAAVGLGIPEEMLNPEVMKSRDELKEAFDEPGSIPRWLDILYDGVMVMLFVAGGWYFTTAMYIIANGIQWFICSKEEPEYWVKYKERKKGVSKLKEGDEL
jgi:hypothetical protein